MSKTQGALVLFSGGQDSATCLAWALDRFERVETVGFDYGQRHRVELECRSRLRELIPSVSARWSGRLGVDHMLDLSVFGEISDTALTSEAEIALDERGLPNTFVPGRNLLFYTFAAALAFRRGFRHLVGGMCETDYSGYPDCRDETLQSLERTLNLGMANDFVLENPLMKLDKAATWRLAEDLGGQVLVDVILEHSHTCYKGERGQRHEWGYGCGTCPACQIRDRGYDRYARKAA